MRILIIRLSAIGDVILASGLIPALRSIYPDSHIAWLTESGNAELLDHHPGLDQLHLWPRQHWHQLRKQRRYPELLSASLALIHTLRAEQYDLVLDLQGLLKSGIWAWFSGGKRRIGLGSREGSQFLMTETLDRRIQSPLMGKEYRKLAGFLGAKPESFIPGIGIADRHAETAASLLKQHGITTPYLVYAPFTTRPQKHWDDARWIAVARQLSRETHYPALLLGGPGDRARAAAWMEKSDGHLIDLTGQTSLGVCAALIAQAKLLLGVDTGLTHLGMALNSPSLALFGSTRPYLEPDNPQGRVLYHPLDCSPCRRRPTCDGRYDCMDLHQVETVLAAARMLLTEEPSRTSSQNPT